MKLEELYESHYISEEAYIKNANPVELLEVFEEAVSKLDNSNVSITLCAVKNNTLALNESNMTEEEKTYIDACQRLLEYYNNGNNKEFNFRFECLLEAPARAPKTGLSGPAPKTGRSGPGFWSKAGEWLKKAATAVSKFTGEVLGAFKAGFVGAAAAGAEGKDNQGKTSPGWQDVNVDYDLKDIPDAETTLGPDDLAKYKIDPTTITKLKQGSLKGVNIINTKTNELAQLKFSPETGTFTIKQIIPTPPPAATRTTSSTPPPATTPTTSSTPTSEKTKNSFETTYFKILKEFHNTSK